MSSTEVSGHTSCFQPNPWEIIVIFKWAEMREKGKLPPLKGMQKGFPHTSETWLFEFGGVFNNSYSLSCPNSIYRVHSSSLRWSHQRKHLSFFPFPPQQVFSTIFAEVQGLGLVSTFLTHGFDKPHSTHDLICTVINPGKELNHLTTASFAPLPPSFHPQKDFSWGLTRQISLIYHKLSV